MAHVCPWWLGYLLINPIRRVLSHPSKIVGPYVKPGMTVVDVGCAMGFFSLWMASEVGDDGRVVCVDVQERMIAALKRRAAKAGVLDRIDPRVCGTDSLGLDDLSGRADFVLAFHVAHEVPDIASLMKQIHAVLKPGGKFLLAEPRGHVKRWQFAKTVALATDAGFEELDSRRLVRSWSALLRPV